MSHFQANLAFLKQKNPILADKILHEPDDAPIKIHPTPSGTATIHLQTPDGIHALHHPQDPREDALRFVHSLPALMEKRNVALFGCGLGYIPQAILQSHPGLQNLWVFEPSLTVLRLALHTTDLTPLLQPPVHLIAGTAREETYTSFMSHLMDIMANPLFYVEIPSFRAAFPTSAETLKHQLHEIHQTGQSGLFTKFKDGPRCLRNLFQNFPSIYQSPGIAILQNHLRGLPAIIIAAGPSLAKNVHLLEQIHDRVLLLATDTTLELLLDRGITPHFVVTVDPTELNLRHFKRDRYPKSCTLIFDPEARPELPSLFARCLTYMTDKHPFFHWLNQQAGPKGTIPKGSMVSHTAFYLARQWGCSPLIFIGQDLALDPHTGGTHIPATANYRQVEYVQDDPAHIHVPLGAAGQSKEPLYWVDGVDGTPVPTIQSFLAYLRMLEVDIRQTSQPVIDATEGGAKIQGTHIRPLADVLNEYGRMPTQGSALIDRAFQQVSPSAKVSANQAEIQREQILRHIQSKAQLARQSLAQVHDSATIRQLEEQIHACRTRLFSDPVADYLIEYAAPQQLFEFLKLGPANTNKDQLRETLKHRLNALLNATLQAQDILAAIRRPCPDTSRDPTPPAPA